jgi:aerobic-type carbon monoxide dehydrogenase small subunit (CoxS/CutS family)
MAAIALTINGKPAAVEAEPDTPLLWFVREHLKRARARNSAAAPANIAPSSPQRSRLERGGFFIGYGT